MNMRWFILAVLLCGFVFSVPTVLINGGDTTTNDTSVILTISADNATECNVSNDDSTWTNFAYNTSYTWVLDSGDGTKTVYLRCNESGVWSSSVSDDILLNTTVPDTTDPSVSSKSPTGGITDSTPEISADVSDSDSGVNESSIVLELDGSSVLHNYDSGEVSYTPSSDLDFGSHNVNLFVADNAGNSENTSWSFTINSEGADFEDLAPEEGNYTSDNRPDIEFTVVNTGSGVDESSLVLTFDGSVISNSSIDRAGLSLSYTYSPSTLSDGNHTVRVCVDDDAAEESCVEWSFYVDTTAPYVGLFVPEDGGVVTSALYISAIIEDDDSGVDEDSIFMELNGVDVTSALHYDGSTETVTFSPSVELTPGTYEVEIWASDEVENEAREDWSFVVASDAPAISSLKPSNGSITTNPRHQISATITDTGSSGIDTDSIRLYVDGSQVTSDAVYNAGSGVLTYTPDEDLEDGTHTVELEVRNNNRQESTKEWSFTVDSSAPAAPSLLKVVQNDSGTYLSWECEDAEEVHSYTLYGSVNPFTSVEGKAPVETFDSDETEFFHDITSRYYYALVAEDEHGNECEPILASTCDVYTETDGWTSYECCRDADCESGYTCDVSVHTCKVATGTTEEADAEDAIEDAEDTIDSARKTGKNVTEAEDYLEDANNAFAAGNFEQAEHFAQLAQDSALSAESLPESELEDEGEKQLPCCPSTFILIAALGFAALRR